MQDANIKRSGYKVRDEESREQIVCQMEHQDLTLLCRDLRSKDKRPLNASMREDGISRWAAH